MKNSGGLALKNPRCVKVGASRELMCRRTSNKGVGEEKGKQRKKERKKGKSRHRTDISYRKSSTQEG